MESLENIKKLIAEKKIKISYMFSNTEGYPVKLTEETPVDIDNSQNQATKMFSNNFYGDRLYITMGSIVHSQSIKYSRDRKNFRGKDFFFDLSQTNNTIKIQPQEIVYVNSNERISLDGVHGAYILPYLSFVEQGLLYIPSYIDAYWDGLLQATIINVSKKPIALNICEKMAICRFYEIVGEPNEEFKKSFLLNAIIMARAGPVF